MKGILIFCLSCREAILKTTDDFILGGEYSGNMFESIHESKWSATMFPRRPDIKSGNLNCPRCMGHFIQRGQILTEHGIVHPGQKTLDTSFNVVNQDGDFKGKLKYVVDSKELPESVDIGSTEGPPVYAEGEVVERLDPPEVEKLSEPLALVCPKCGKKYKDPKWYDKHLTKCDYAPES